MNHPTSAHYAELPPSKGPLSPQTLNLDPGTQVDMWGMAPPPPSVGTKQFFESPPMDMAPAPVRWAYALSWFWLGVIPLFAMLNHMPASGLLNDLSTLAGTSAVWGVALWLNRGLRRGRRAAWWLQIPLSILGLFSCWIFSIPFYGYVLCQWFKPEVKAWFDLH